MDNSNKAELSDSAESCASESNIFPLPLADAITYLNLADQSIILAYNAGLIDDKKAKRIGANLTEIILRIKKTIGDEVLQPPKISPVGIKEGGATFRK